MLKQEELYILNDFTSTMFNFVVRELPFNHDTMGSDNHWCKFNTDRVLMLSNRGYDSYHDVAHLIELIITGRDKYLYEENFGMGKERKWTKKIKSIEFDTITIQCILVNELKLSDLLIKDYSWLKTDNFQESDSKKYCKIMTDVINSYRELKQRETA